MSLELAAFYGFITGIPLIAGAIITKFYTFKEKPIGMIMAFGSAHLHTWEGETHILRYTHRH